MADAATHIRWFESIAAADGDSVGGKNASLGEMISALSESGVRVPGGFALTADAYRDFLSHNGLDNAIRDKVGGISDDESARKAGKAIRSMIRKGAFPDELAGAIDEAYRALCERYGDDELSVAVRSSATAEDLPEASFAGQLESFLNVSGVDDLHDACRRCFASLFTARAIGYREEHGFDHLQVAVSVGVQKMVRADKAGAGVMFSIDTETGFPRTVVINAAWGLGDTVVGGRVDPDEYRVFKPLLDEPSARPIIAKTCGKKQVRMVFASSGEDRTRIVENKRKRRERFVLDDDRILELARWAIAIERHYERPMDIEWALDAQTDELFIVQARPETVQSRAAADTLKTYRLRERTEPILTGVAIGNAVAAGEAVVVDDPSAPGEFPEGSILVTEMTDPDWVPLMRRAGGVVTDRGGRTSHAAIVSRELGVPAVIGASDATSTVETGDELTVNCIEGDAGCVHAGLLGFDEEEVDLSSLSEVKTRIMMNLASPDAGERWWRLPVRGVGLARLEFIIGNQIGVHPLALMRYDDLNTAADKKRIDRLTRGYADRREFFIERLALGVARIAAAQHPHPVVVRLSDFKTNEYAGLLGGEQFEPAEANPMLGFRGASRYYSERYRDGFALECRALRRVREEIGFRNVIVMVPFCRTLEEADRVLGAMAQHGLTRGENGLQVYVMCEIPSNVLLADEFADRFDGFSIGTNDLTQLVLGVDRDSADLAHVFDERNEAVKRMIRMLIEHAHAKGRTVGLCGQAPSDHPDFAAFLVGCGIDSISVNPDSALAVHRAVEKAEMRERS
jgi:pyruvate,water dikinase